jgi:small subunit ribosomal protein S6e
MVDFKIVISDPKTGKTYQKEVKDDDANKFVGLKIGDKLKGDFLELGNVEIEITGGSDYCGFPMRKDVLGSGRKKILAVGGVGVRNKEKGIKKRKTVCGNTIYAKISQINVRVLGGKPIKVKEEKPKSEEKPAKTEDKVEEKKDEPKKEVKEPEKEDKSKAGKPEKEVPTAADLAEKKKEDKK